jgi:3'(2'), 5'-bisphosphate nucleotidase
VSTPPVGDGAFARWLADRVGRELLALREEAGYADPAALRDAGDKRAHESIIAQLARWRPADAVLSEEGDLDPARLTADRVWIVDPLDGTREFAEGRSDWAVHIALWSRTGGLAAGAVALPAQLRVLATDLPPAYPPPAGTPAAGRPGPRLAVSRTRPAAFLAAVADEVEGELVPMGSAGAKIAAVITGDVDAYLHAGGQYEWDSAAPVAVAGATGLHTSRLDGSALAYNRADPRLPDLLVCRRDLAPRLLAAVARHLEEQR